MHPPAASHIFTLVGSLSAHALFGDSSQAVFGYRHSPPYFHTAEGHFGPQKNLQGLEVLANYYEKHWK
jgi:hypothetical protein